MTDMPKTGFLCAGKNALELSVSVHCAQKLMKELKISGFSTGSCYTELWEMPTPERMSRAAKNLSYLCITNDLVITVGCEGFASGDVIPDITEAICPKKAGYFSNVLCGSLGVMEMAVQAEGAEEEREESVEIPPSRAYAGICDGALILNFSNDVYTAVRLMKALIPAIGFTVYNISGKSAASVIEFEKSLKTSPECKDFFKKCSAVNN